MEMNIRVVGCFLRLLLDDIRWRMEEHGSQLHVHIFIGDGRSIPGGCGRRRRRREYVRAYGYRFICLRHNTGKIENCFRLYFIFRVRERLKTEEGINLGFPAARKFHPSPYITIPRRSGKTDRRGDGGGAGEKGKYHPAVRQLRITVELRTKSNRRHFLTEARGPSRRPVDGWLPNARVQYSSTAVTCSVTLP